MELLTSQSEYLNVKRQQLMIKYIMRIPPSVDGLKYCLWKMSSRKASKANDDDWKKRIKSMLHCRRTVPIRKKMDDVNGSIPSI